MIFPMKLRHWILSACAVAALALPARAADALADELLTTANAVIDMARGLSPEQLEARIPAIRERMGTHFAFAVLVQRAFGRNWSRLSAAEQAEVVDLLPRLIIRTYAGQLSSSERPVITIDEIREITPERREALSTITFQGSHINVIYRLGHIDGAWKVYDVLAEGVSVVSNYRRQFDAHFEKKDGAALLTLLRDKATTPAQS